MDQLWFAHVAARMTLSAYAAAILAAGPALGGKTLGPETQADTIDVPADRDDARARLERLPFLASVRDLDDATERVLTMADLLEEAAGVRVRRYGSLGSFTTASIRGSSPGQVEVYLDGIPINSAQWGATNLSELPVDNLAHVEIYRASAPVEFGTPGIGGVVNLVSRPVEANRTTVALSSGSYDTWKSSILHSGSLGSFDHLISYHQLQTGGDFSFLYDPGTRFWNTEDDTVLTRENNRFREHGLLVKLRSPPAAGWRFHLHDDWYLKESGLPGHGNLLYSSASFDTRRHMLTLKASSPGYLGRRVRTELTGFHLSKRDRFYNPENEPGLSPNDQIDQTRMEGGKALLTLFWLGTSQTWNLLLEQRRERFTRQERHPTAQLAFERERSFLTLAAQDEILLFRDRLSLLAAYRYQESEDNFSEATPFGRPPEERGDPPTSTFHGSTFGLRMDATDQITIKANRTEYARFPTLLELFGTSGEVRPSPELVPETGITWDGGIRLSGQPDRGVAASLEVNAYRSERDALIYFIQNSLQSFVAQNLERAVAKGLELSGDFRFGSRLRLDGTFTTQEIRHKGKVPHWNDKWLPYVSPRELFLRASLRLGRPTFRYEQTHFDRYYQDRANTETDHADARSYHNVGARIRLFEERLTLDLEIQNIMDQRTSDVFGYPMPGRTVYLTAEVDIVGD